MLQPFTSLIASALRLDGKQVHNALRLLADGATIPFISRYRKEATGGMDEVQLAEVKAMHDRLCELQKRKETIVKTIEEAGRMTPELQQRIADCWDAAGLEDLYLPYKPRRRTRAEMAREKGLEPLARMLMKQSPADVGRMAQPFVRGEVGSVDEALKGARDIMAEWVSESEAARQAVRGIFARPRLFRGGRAVVAHLLAPPAGHAPGRGRGRATGEHRPRRRSLHRAVEAHLRAGAGGIVA